MERLVSVRFDRVLADDERDELTRILRSAGIEAGPWRSPSGSGRTYSLLRFESGAVPEELERLGARAHEPALTILEIAPDRAERASSLAAALGGDGAPSGVLDCLELPASVLIELDEARTPLATVVDVVDIELGGAKGRRITPVLGLSDERLAAFAAALLSDPELDASRLIETYTDSLRPALQR